MLICFIIWFCVNMITLVKWRHVFSLTPPGTALSGTVSTARQTTTGRGETAPTLNQATLLQQCQVQRYHMLCYCHGEKNSIISKEYIDS